MQRYHQLQIRFPESSVFPGAKISCRRNDYILGRPTSETLKGGVPIGAVMNGYTRQYELLQNEKVVGAVWFYYYGAIEGNRWAVLDELALFDDARTA